MEHKNSKARVAAANSATLLVAATFEEFVREMAREFARSIVANAVSFEKLPPKIASTAWKRTMDSLSKIRFDRHDKMEHVFNAAQERFRVVHDFCRGDLTQEIYRDLIHNENNMRPGEINGLFKISGLGDLCSKIACTQSILDIFGESEHGKAHGKLISGLDNFFDRRNLIAHSLNGETSSGPGQIINDINMLQCIGKAIYLTIEDIIKNGD